MAYHSSTSPNRRRGIGKTASHDPSYKAGDVPVSRGVCTDVIVRAYRGIGIDLQLLVNRDMRENFSAYPHRWGLSHPDPNIDHRRVPNLMAFFSRQGTALPIGQKAADYRPGDIVTWRPPDGRPHIGWQTAARSSFTISAPGLRANTCSSRSRSLGIIGFTFRMAQNSSSDAGFTAESRRRSSERGVRPSGCGRCAGAHFHA